MQQEAFSRSVEDLVYLASCAVNGEVPDPARAGGMDLESLYRIADWHMMTAVAASALEAAGIREPAFSEAKLTDFFCWTLLRFRWALKLWAA